MLVQGHSSILHRVAPMMPVFRSVAADAAGEVFRRGEQRRRDGYRVLADDLVTKAPLAPGMTSKRASDLLFVLLGPETYRSFVIELGWTREGWAEWTINALVRDIFGFGQVSR
jgi:hypothetical protein